jgi:acyl dehydratase
MSTFDDLNEGDVFDTPVRVITADDVDVLVRIGGYTHPLFTDPEHARASIFGKRPLPGQAVLLLMGGLVEQTGRFDETVLALTHLDKVVFHKAAFEGDSIHVAVEVLEKGGSGTGRGVVEMFWHCRRGDELVVSSVATMLFRLTP